MRFENKFLNNLLVTNQHNFLIVLLMMHETIIRRIATLNIYEKFSLLLMINFYEELPEFNLRFIFYIYLHLLSYVMHT